METGAEILVRCLREQGVDTVFGYPGASILSVYDVLRREESGIRHIMCSHEQFCSHAADGYARSSGKTGVVLATSGPGATNLVTGIANAFMDSVPLVAITGNVPVEMLGRDSFQETDIMGVTMPITKHNYIVKNAAELEQTVRDAFRIASSHRCGPVLVDIPRNVLEAETPQQGFAFPHKLLPPLDEATTETALAALNEAKTPFICAGGGVIASNAADLLKRFAEKLSCPVALTAMGKGAFPARHPLYCGIVGMEAEESAVECMAGCDLFVGIGLRFSERLLANINKYAPGCRILHIDVDRAEIDKNLSSYISVNADAATVLEALISRLSPKERTQKASYCPIFSENAFVFDCLNEVYPDALYTTEVGRHQMDACHLLATEKPRHFITSGGLGTMGFGLPAAIGALIANPDKRVINIAGDGSFNMNGMELGTAAKYHLPVIQLVMNNGKLGMIEEWQDRSFGGRRFECQTGIATDYAKFAAAFGIHFAVAENEEELRKALLSAPKDAPMLIEVKTK